MSYNYPQNATGNGCKCFVFDFDCTITSSHWFLFLESFSEWIKVHPQYNSEEIKNLYTKLINMRTEFKRNPNILTSLTEKETRIIIIIFMNGNDRFKMIKTFLNELKQNKYDLFIASRNYKENIELFLNIVKMTDVFQDINAQNCGNNRTNCTYISKDNYILDLYKNKYYGIIRYADDDPTEHELLITKIKQDKISVDYKYYGALNCDKCLNIGLEKNKLGLSLNSINAILRDVTSNKISHFLLTF